MILSIFNPKYRELKAMMRAIDLARTCGGKVYSKTDGLRVIRRFERSNGIRFDPFNEYHLQAVSGMAWNESLIRRLKNLFKSWGLV